MRHLLLSFCTVVAGARHALQRRTAHGLFLVVFAAFVAHALEGFVIDLDHWRHFHVLMALCWGLMLAEQTQGVVSRLVRIRPARMLSSRAAHMAS